MAGPPRCRRRLPHEARRRWWWRGRE
uniref:Uncharacterized protein n=1 Tax=Arundo donax TaxID=35708 RepID=A0A0A9FSE7_ARUDO